VYDVIEGVREPGGEVPRPSVGDVQTALKNWKGAGDGYGVIRIGSKIFMKTGLRGGPQPREGQGALRWDDARFMAAVNKVLRDGLVWVDRALSKDSCR